MPWEIRPLVWTMVLNAFVTLLPAASAELRLRVTDEHDRITPVRIHLRDAQDRPVRVAPFPFWHDHIVCPGDATLVLDPGSYRYTVERGHEFERLSGSLQVTSGRTELSLRMERIADLRSDGWYSSDLHIHRPLDDVPLLAEAEDLDFAPVITWWNERNTWREHEPPHELRPTFARDRILDVMAGEDEREGGALLYFRLDRPLPLEGSDREIPSPMRFVRQARARQANVWIDIEKPFWWDVPTWVLMADPDSIGIANNHMCRDTMLDNEAWGYPRDQERLPGPRGNGYWTQKIYYHLLNAGLNIPPSAGSASGVLPNPVGYNRVYVHLDRTFDRDNWFAGLSRGRSFVTNGPLLLATVNDTLPDAPILYQDERALVLSVTLTTPDPVPQLEVIYNGTVLHQIACRDARTQRHELRFTPPGPGWLLVRAIADRRDTFRFASTAPWWILREAEPPPVHRSATRFFLQWLDQRIERVRRNTQGLPGAEEVLHWHQVARERWQSRHDRATAP